MDKVRIGLIEVDKARAKGVQFQRPDVKIVTHKKGRRTVFLIASHVQI